MNARQKEILTRIQAQGKVWVEELVTALGTTPQTIRKDLRILEEKHLILRFHGGASLLAGVEYLAYDTRREIAAGAKQAIAAATVRLLPDNATVFLNAGTTTEAVARAMGQGARLRVITDNVNMANILRQIPGVSTITAGGEVRPSDGAITGASAVAFLSQFRVDYAIIGAAAIGGEGHLYDFDLNEAEVVRTMISRAAHVILTADATKFAGRAPVRIGHLSEIHTFITDRCRPAKIRQILTQSDTSLIETSSTPALLHA